MVDRSYCPGFRGAGPRLLCLLASLSIAGGCVLPRDPNGTLNRVTGGTLRVGISPHPPWTDWKGDASPTGIEIELIERFASELGAEVVWVRGSETPLLKSLEQYKIDLVAAGMTDDHLWKDRVGLSRPFAETAAGRHVLAAPPGENRFLLRLDRFLARQENEILRRIATDREPPVEATEP